MYRNKKQNTNTQNAKKMFAIIEYTAQHDGSVRDYNIRKVFAESDYRICLDYFKRQIPKNWNLSSNGWGMYKIDVACNWTYWRLLTEIPNPD